MSERPERLKVDPRFRAAVNRYRQRSAASGGGWNYEYWHDPGADSACTADGAGDDEGGEASSSQ